MQGGWIDRPLDQLYDVAHLTRSMKQMYGIEVLTSLVAFADEASTCRGLQQVPACHVRPPHVEGTDEVAYYRSQIDASINTTWQGCMSSRPDVAGRKDSITVLLGHTNAFLQWRWSRLPPSIPANLHQALRFTDRLQGLAAEVVRGLGGRDAYNGVHLRVEGDSGYWIRHCNFLGDVPSLYWSMYYQAAASLGFNNSVPLYAASGHAALDSPMMAIFKKRFASKVLTKADFLTPEKLEGLGVDQLAAIDYLVLRHAAKVVGFPFSSMSAYLRSARYLDGYHPDQTFQLADGSGLLWELGRVGSGLPYDPEHLSIGCWSFFNNPHTGLATTAMAA